MLIDEYDNAGSNPLYGENGHVMGAVHGRALGTRLALILRIVFEFQHIF